MNKLSKYLWVTALGVGLWSCTSDEPVVTPEIPKFTGEQAMMTINLFSTDNMTRAGEDAVDETTGYDKGSAAENEITTVNFYFYDRDGEFVMDYKGATFNFSDGADPLIGKIGSTKIILTGLASKNYPEYMIAVANPPENSRLSWVNQSTKETEGLPLSQVVSTPIRGTGETNRNLNPWKIKDEVLTDFVMTSATHNGNLVGPYYFVTHLKEENFAEQGEGHEPNGEWYERDEEGNIVKDEEGNPVLLTTEPVNIHIERLAAKVELDFKKTGEDKFELTPEGYYERTLPKITLTIGTDANGQVQTVEKTYKVRLYGWGVNGTAKNERYFKRVNTGSTPFVTSDGWDFSGTNRCYWARTPGYGNNKYPSSFEDVDKKTGPSDELNDIYANSETLKYISWNDVKANSFAAGNTIAYIMPQTEPGEFLNLSANQLRHSAVTEILIAAQIIDEELQEGEEFNLYQLGETYYTKEAIKNHILALGGKNIWKKVDDTHTSQIEADDIDITYWYDGVFRFTVSEAAKNQLWYTDQECTVPWGNTNLNTNHKAVLDELNSFLPYKQTYAFVDGLMYYNIPIQHLRPYTKGGEIKTGMFGVVRNHWYKVTVNSLANFGHAVYRPEEHIIPSSDDTEFMIGASIKVLSWRLVRQNADL